MLAEQCHGGVELELELRETTICYRPDPKLTDALDKTGIDASAHEAVPRDTAEWILRTTQRR